MNEIVSHTQYKGKDALKIEGLGNFCLSRTLDCGQCFRWEPADRSLTEHIGIAHGRAILAVQKAPGELILPEVSEQEYTAIWRDYFSLGLDWAHIRSDIESRAEPLRRAAETASGIHILSQDPYEALVSFIISQCNNIPRIKGLIRAICEHYGDRISTPDGSVAYTFPSAERILSEPLSSLTALKLGYRDEYIYSACRAVCDGVIDTITEAKDTRDAERILLGMQGIGKKVAACVLLFGFGRLDAFPVDIWMKRSLARHFPDCRDFSVFGEYAGVAQQYLFYSERYSQA